MKLNEIKKWIESLPEEFLDYDVVNAEEGPLDEDGDLTYRLDKPIMVLTVNEPGKEIIFLNDSPITIENKHEYNKN